MWPYPGLGLNWKVYLSSVMKFISNLLCNLAWGPESFPLSLKFTISPDSNLNFYLNKYLWELEAELHQGHLLRIARRWKALAFNISTFLFIFFFLKLSSHIQHWVLCTDPFCSCIYHRGLCILPLCTLTTCWDSFLHLPCSSSTRAESLHSGTEAVCSLMITIKI